MLVIEVVLPQLRAFIPIPGISLSLSLSLSELSRLITLSRNESRSSLETHDDLARKSSDRKRRGEVARGHRKPRGNEDEFDGGNFECPIAIYASVYRPFLAENAPSIDPLPDAYIVLSH